METKTIHNRNISFVEVLAALVDFFTLCALFLIQGTAKMTVEGNTCILKENESTTIPIAAWHELSNPGRLPLVIIEVQNGRYINDDDIKITAE